MGIDQRYASVDSLAASTIANIDSAEARIERREREKDSGWLSKLTGGGADKDKNHHHHGHTLGHGQKEWERSQSWQLVRHNNEEGGELARTIGFLTATASENWALVLDVCERASASDASAKEAIRALRREFKYGQPQAQLSAARLWAIMLRNSSDTFISQSTSRKFLDTLEDLLLSSRTNPVVMERVLDVLAAAAYASGSKKNTGFRGLWKKVKPHDKPDEGIPFDTDDAMFNPPVLGIGGAGDHRPFIDTPQTRVFHPQHQHQLSYPNQQIYHQAQAKNSEHGHGNGDAPVPPPTKERERSERKEREHTHTGDRERERRDSNRDREPRDPNRERTATIIPPEEDIRRLFQECIIGKGDAALLSQALLHMTPENFFEELTGERKERGVVGGNTTVKELQMKCISEQELIAAQIPWAFAGAERSRKEVGEGGDETTEEKLLGDLLGANEELVASLGEYEDLERLAAERKVTEESRRDVGGRRGRDEIERQIHQEELLPSSSHAQPPLPANLTPGRASPNLVGSPRTPSPNWRTGTASQSPSSSPPMRPPYVSPSIPSRGSRPSSIVIAGEDNVKSLALPPLPRGLSSLGFVFPHVSRAWNNEVFDGRDGGESSSSMARSKNADGGYMEDGEIDLITPESDLTPCQALALCSYTPSSNDRDHISFAHNEIIDILDQEGDLWPARKADGTFGLAPSKFLRPLVAG
ncbi:hypothetical protein V5O48_011874 [Marasmius crinis-equi]|uniref:Class E vacuolar protein-sorting machinery protein HSE1 n=1 Tax=Marasmius crinis-equi TaxID=585013 RepID=A0ABR3F4C6_9AGAR